MIIKREIVHAIIEIIDKYPLIAITGPRQSGKTTMLKSLFPNYRYVSLENPDIRNFALSDPNGFLNEFSNQVILDEVQRVPALFSYLQTKIDEDRVMGQFILSGSQNFHLMQHITQSLAGRVAIFKLFPFDFQELKIAGLLQDNYIDNLLKGFYPAIYDRNIPSKEFYSNYVQTYVQRDVSELIAIKDLRLFQNFIALCATRAGQLLNLNSIAKECGISQPTAKSWMSALANSYIMFLLYPYYENFSKRIVKTPKLYFYDSGLLCYLLKLDSVEQIQLNAFKGNLFENMMIAEYVKRIHHTNKLNEIWFWRDNEGHEVDLIVQHGQQQDAFEFKSTQTIMPDLFKGLNLYQKISQKEHLQKSLVYTGKEYQNRTAGKVVPWNEFGKSI
ncbi:MAG: ATP-binding protein [Tannerella sp.]|jgi:predicted AAA+ superfamily ATPase|nr:ATP-binding protein [Tannerella sp.]